MTVHERATKKQTRNVYGFVLPRDGGVLSISMHIWADGSFEQRIIKPQTWARYGYIKLLPSKTPVYQSAFSINLTRPELVSQSIPAGDIVAGQH
jgi:hypothetical protein